MNVKGPTSRADRADATRAELVKTARGLFAQRGYAAVPAEEIVREAGLTRGALYHHFGGKRELFATVVEQVEGELTEALGREALGQTDPVGVLRVGCSAWLDACLEPELQQIVLRDAPSVLGWEEWRALGERYGLGLLRAALEAAMDAGALKQQPATPLAHVLLAVLDEAAMVVVRAEDVKAARAEMGQTLDGLIDGLLAAR
jgi:AcrR family transcriptional regulator